VNDYKVYNWVKKYLRILASIFTCGDMCIADRKFFCVCVSPFYGHKYEFDSG
jgi:hypothetical protein